MIWGENEKANMTNPGRPNANFDGFVMSVIKQIGCALEVPFEIVLKCFSNNYSASRGALLEFWKTVNMYRGWLAADFCQPIFEEFMCEAVAKGRINAPGFFADPLVRKAYCAAEWNGPSAGQLDPKKEVEAAELRVQGGFSTRDRETTELTGGDYYKNMKQRKREERPSPTAPFSPKSPLRDTFPGSRSRKCTPFCETPPFFPAPEVPGCLPGAIRITWAGQLSAHFPHPTHFSRSTWG